MSELAEIYCSRLPERLATSIEPSPELEAWLQQSVSQATETWPGLDVPPELFVAYMGDRADETGDEQSIRKVLTNDLYLACACAVGDANAIAAFEETAIGNLRGALHELDKGTGLTQEIQQRVREKLLAADDGSQPGIAGFRGRGSLVAWVRTIGMRMAYRHVSKGKKQVELKDTHLGDSTGDMELEYFKGKYKQDFEAAFADALKSLGPRERTLLRMSVIDGLSCEQLGGMYSVNKSTVSRWLSATREKLSSATKDNLKARLDLSPSEVDSIVRLVRSRIDMSVRQLLVSRPQ